MTKDEAIEKLREALISVMPVLNRLDGIRHLVPEFPELDAAHEALANTEVIEAPTSEAVAESSEHWIATTYRGDKAAFGNEGLARAWAGKNGAVTHVPCRAIFAAPALDAVGVGSLARKLASEYQSGTVMTDFTGPKVTLHYRTMIDAEAAFDAIADAIDGQVGVEKPQQGWVSVADRLPEVEQLVMVYSPPTQYDHPGEVNITFDCIDPNDDDSASWLGHNENYEHFCCVAKPENSIGPSEKAPYTHWMPLPPAPSEQSAPAGSACQGGNTSDEQAGRAAPKAEQDQQLAAPCHASEQQQVAAQSAQPAADPGETLPGSFTSAEALCEAMGVDLPADPAPTDAGIPISDERADGQEDWMDELRELVSNFRKATYEFARGQEPSDHALMMQWQKAIFDHVRQARGQQQAGVPEVLLDGYAVYQEVLRVRGGGQLRTSAESVSDVLDAAVRLIRASVPGEA